MDCARLDAFLDGELSGEDAAGFEAHWPRCAACREAVERQRWIDDTLRSGEWTRHSVPATVLAATADAIQIANQKQRWLRVMASGLAAAASIALLAAWHLREPSAAPGSAGGSVSMPVDVVQREATPRRSRGLQEGSRGLEETTAPTKSIATFTAGGGGIAITVASESPEVTIVQFYSTTEADRRLQRQRELEAKYRELIGG